MPLCKAEAITIRLTDFSETSQIAWFYTREFGRLSALAKGSKRERNNFEGRLDLLCHNQIVFARKSRTTLHILTECKLLDRFMGLRAGVERLYAGLYAAELVREMTPAEEAQPEVFGLLLATLRSLSDGEDVDLALLAAEARLLALTGYAPLLGACAVCGSEALPKSTAAFSSTLGGVLCSACRGRDPKSIGVPRSALAALQRLADGTAAEAAEARLRPQTGERPARNTPSDAGGSPAAAEASAPPLARGMVTVLRKQMKATYAHHLNHEPKLMRYV